jgi:phosphotransferase system, enzyme I, PtsP
VGGEPAGRVAPAPPPRPGSFADELLPEASALPLSLSPPSLTSGFSFPPPPFASRLDGVVEFVAFAAKQMTIVKLLDDSPQRFANIFGADVVSLYLLEGDGNTLVLRGNVGFPDRTRGKVRLAVGEGITGTVLSTRRPFAATDATRHADYRHFPELGEEKFPVFAAVPILGRSGPLGATVLQRREGAFTDDDLALLVALSSTLAAGIRAAELMDTARDKLTPLRRAGGGTRKVTLPGRPVVPGRVIGAVAATKRPPARAREGQAPGEVARLKAAFDVAEKSILGLLAAADAGGQSENARFLHTHMEILGDARLRGEVLRHCDDGLGVAEALGLVVRAVARAAATQGSPFLEERARQIEDLCDALLMIASADPRAQLPTQAILVCEQLSVFDVLVSARSRPVGIAVSERAPTIETQLLLSLLDIPALMDVGGLFRWVADGDIALLDADHGLFVVNPSRSEVALVREARKKKP